MTDPVQLLDLISRTARRVVIWTHIVDDHVSQNKVLASKLAGRQSARYGDFDYGIYRHDYGFQRKLTGYWGGTQSYSNWLGREDLLRALTHFGWTGVQLGFDDPLHQNGPSLAVVAVRDEARSA